MLLLAALIERSTQLIDALIGRLTDWLIDWLTNGLDRCLTGCACHALHLPTFIDECLKFNFNFDFSARAKRNKVKFICNFNQSRIQLCPQAPLGHSIFITCALWQQLIKYWNANFTDTHKSKRKRKRKRNVAKFNLATKLMPNNNNRNYYNNK